MKKEKFGFIFKFIMKNVSGDNVNNELTITIIIFEKINIDIQLVLHKILQHHLRNSSHLRN